MDVPERLYVDLHRDGTLEACHPLVDYLQVQIGGNVEANEAPYDSDELVEPRTAANIIRRLTIILQHMAPLYVAIAPPEPTPHSGGMT